MDKNLIEYLMNRYDLESDSNITVSGDGQVDCYGLMPNTNQEGWFFAGYEEELEVVMRREV